MGRSHLHTYGGTRLPKKGRRKLNGYRTFVDQNGTIHVVPREAERVSFPLVPLLLFVGLLFTFKAIAMVNVGVADYTEKVVSLSSGTYLEQGAAMVLYPDPATMWMFEALRPIVQ